MQSTVSSCQVKWCSACMHGFAMQCSAQQGVPASGQGGRHLHERTRPKESDEEKEEPDQQKEQPAAEGVAELHAASTVHHAGRAVRAQMERITAQAGHRAVDCGSMPEGEEDAVADDAAEDPGGEQVDVPVPGVRRVLLEAPHEGVVDHRCRRVRHERADVQQVLPARRVFQLPSQQSRHLSVMKGLLLTRSCLHGLLLARSDLRNRMAQRLPGQQGRHLPGLMKGLMFNRSCQRRACCKCIVKQAVL